jgi:pimeloyl-ACP methyl ester carboxylesterase
MQKYRKHGKNKPNIAVLHGGPGAPGTVGDLARQLGKKLAVLEPMQSQRSISAQIQVLHDILGKETKLPVTLIGHSWGAWLAWLFAAEHPEYIRKIILVGCGAFQSKFVEQMNLTRQQRLSKQDKTEIDRLFKKLTKAADKSALLPKIGKIMDKTDSYQEIATDCPTLPFQTEVFVPLMKELNHLRSSGELLQKGRQIKCPVIAIHGDYDPHPAEGIQLPLESVLQNFRFYLLEKCGHNPWREKFAKDKFYKIVLQELDWEL